MKNFNLNEGFLHEMAMELNYQVEEKRINKKLFPLAVIGLLK